MFVVYVVALPVMLLGPLWLESWSALMLYRWFALPLGAPAITIAHAMGLNLCVSVICRHLSLAQRAADGRELAWRAFGYFVAVPLTAVAIGWVIKTWWM